VILSVHLAMPQRSEPNAHSKRSRKKAGGPEQAGYTIVANVGDQPSDLQGGHAEKRFLLPDPFYRVP
jgi:HAD superfamily, subfamily IIIB (Acid phosphatase)